MSDKSRCVLTANEKLLYISYLLSFPATVRRSLEKDRKVCHFPLTCKYVPINLYRILNMSTCQKTFKQMALKKKSCIAVLVRKHSSTEWHWKKKVNILLLLYGYGAHKLVVKLIISKLQTLF